MGFKKTQISLRQHYLTTTVLTAVIVIFMFMYIFIAIISMNLVCICNGNGCDLNVFQLMPLARVCLYPNY